MRMPILFLASFFLTFSGILRAQNLPSSLYDTHLFPKDMHRVQEFIDATSSDVIIYNYNSSSFQLKGKASTEIKLPLKEAFSIIFLDRETGELATTVNLRYDYDFPLAKLNPSVEVNEELFTLSNIFKTAVEYFDGNEYSILPELNKMRNDLRSYDEYITLQIDYFSALAKDYRIDEPIFEGVAKEIDVESYTISEIDQFLVDRFIENLSYEDKENLLTTFFERQILDKFTREKTLEVLDYIFNREDVVGFIEKEVFQPSLKIQFNQDGYLNIPKKVATVNAIQENLFPIHSIEVRIDFKEKKMLVYFVSPQTIDVNLKKGMYLGNKVKNKSLKTNTIQLEVSAKGNILRIDDLVGNQNSYTVEIK